MQRKASPIRRLLPVSALAFALSSCGAETPRPNVNPPADILLHAAEPQITAEALTSEEIYERQRDAQIEWGRGNASMIDRACWWFQDAGVKLTCPRRAK